MEPLRWSSRRGERTSAASSYLKARSRLGRVVQLVLELPRNLLLYVFRAAPYPVDPGLLIVGRPDRQAPVLVTANYDLTVRRVARALVGTDCYLLVAPAGGINVWCSAGGGHFSVESLVSILKTSDVEGFVDHRRLILPQLCANGIRAAQVRRRTGWNAVFGPARAEDVPRYLQLGGRKTEAMRQVSFDRLRRSEMALAMWGSLALRYTLFPLLLFGWTAALWFAPLLAAVGLAVSLGCFTLPGKTFVQKAGLVATVPWLGTLGVAAWIDVLSPRFAIATSVLVIGAALLVGTAFAGYSPYWRCGYCRLFFGAPALRLVVASGDCSGCGICREVCPVGCFAATGDRAFALRRPERCVGCAACVNNCPGEAIVDPAGGPAPEAAPGVCCAGGCR